MQRLALLLVMVFGLLLLPTAVRADDSLPPRPAGAPAYGDGATPLYDRYEVDAFSVDTRAGLTDTASRTLNQWTNLLLAAKGWLIKLAIRASEYALSGDLFAPLTAQAGQAMASLQAWLWGMSGGGGLVTGALALAGLWGLVMTLSGRQTRSMQVLGSTALVLVISFALMGWAPGALPSLQAGARAASTQGIQVVAVATGNGDATSMTQRAGAAAWDALVYQPWLSHEFTDRNAAAAYGEGALSGGRILAMLPTDRLRMYQDPSRFPNDAARNAYLQPWLEDFGPRRMLMALWTGAAGAGWAAPVLLLAGGVLACQLGLLVIAALLPLWLLAALWWPGGGLRLLRSILAVGLGALLWQVVLALVLGVVLWLTQAAPTVLSAVGWSGQALLMAVMATAAYRYRFAWLRQLGAPAPAATGGWAVLPGLARPARTAVSDRRALTAFTPPGAGSSAELRVMSPAAGGPAPRWEAVGETEVAAERRARRTATARAELREEMLRLRRQMGLEQDGEVASLSQGPQQVQGAGGSGSSRRAAVAAAGRDPGRAASPAEMPRQRPRP